jgi:hypothetical protein
MDGLAEIAKAKGLTKEADAFKAIADSCWQDCMAASDDLQAMST